MNILLGNWKYLPHNEIRLKTNMTQNKGFFCALTWLLQSLSYIDDNYVDKMEVGFDYFSHNYGSYPNFSVFGKYLITKYPALKNPNKSIDLKEIMLYNYKPLHDNFQYAHDLFFKYFEFSDEIYKQADKTSNLFNNKKILGLHYRGTDKLGMDCAEHTTIDDFISMVENYITENKIDEIFFCTDSLNFRNRMIKKYSNRYTMHYNKDQVLSEKPLHLSRLNIIENIVKSIKRGKKELGKELEKELEKECIINEHELKEVIVDSILLSRCSIVIKTHSLVSSFSKIINPNLEIYRLNGCPEIYYPESFIPFYKFRNSSSKWMF